MSNELPKDLYGYLMQCAREDQIPLMFHIDLTFRCDLACVHCYLEDRKRTELTLEEYDAFFSDLAALGGLFLLVSGGDIFVRPDALDILRSASRHGFDLSLITHGMALTEAVADELANIGVRTIAASVYSDVPEVHDEVTLRAGSFHKTMEGLRRVQERGIRVTMKTPVFEVNQGAQETMPAFAEENGMALQMGSHIRGGNVGDDLLSLNLPINDKVRVTQCTIPGIASIEGMGQADPNEHACGAGNFSGYLGPDGDVRACSEFDGAVGNIRETPLVDLWQNAPMMKELRELRRKDFVGCNSCENNNFCSRCPGLAMRETGSISGSAPSKCRESTALRMAIEQNQSELEAKSFDLFEVLGHEREARV